jgi:hypothetical protein
MEQHSDFGPGLSAVLKRHKFSPVVLLRLQKEVEDLISEESTTKVT